RRAGAAAGQHQRGGARAPFPRAPARGPRAGGRLRHRGAGGGSGFRPRAGRLRAVGGSGLMEALRAFAATPWAAAIGLALAAWVAWFIVARVLVVIAARLAAASPMHWDDVVARHGVLSQLAHVVPALVVLAGIGGVQGRPSA